MQLLRAAAAEGIIDAVDRATQTALHLAAQRGLKAAVRVLLELGSRVDFADAEGEAALAKAARGGHTGCVALLLDAGAAPDATSGGGHTALMCACAKGRRECVALLLRRGASAEPCEHSSEVKRGQAVLGSQRPVRPPHRSRGHRTRGPRTSACS